MNVSVTTATARPAEQLLVTLYDRVTGSSMAAMMSADPAERLAEQLTAAAECARRLAGIAAAQPAK
jgi:hypothetical protein